VLLSTPLHASSNFTVSVQLANKNGLNKKIQFVPHRNHITTPLQNESGLKPIYMEVCYWALLFISLVILHHLLNVSVQLANKREFTKTFAARMIYNLLLCRITLWWLGPRSDVTIDTISQSVCWAPSGSHDQLLWGALSDERSGLSSLSVFKPVGVCNRSSSRPVPRIEHIECAWKENVFPKLACSSPPLFVSSSASSYNIECGKNDSVSLHMTT
jgi:hypothetical protein